MIPLLRTLARTVPTMTIPDAVIPVINLIGMVCTLYPALRAVLFLRSRSAVIGKSRSMQETWGGTEPDSKFDRLPVNVDRELESLAQHWSPGLFRTFVVGVAALTLAALLQLLVALGVIGVA